MEKRIVAIVRFEKPLESVRRAVDLSHGLDHLPSKAKVFIKPNIVFWTRTTSFPKWGVITTSGLLRRSILALGVVLNFNEDIFQSDLLNLRRLKHV